jgi:hypothetical protein
VGPLFVWSLQRAIEEPPNVEVVARLLYLQEVVGDVAGKKK